MEGLAIQEEDLFQLFRPTGFDELEVAVFVGSVNFVPDDRVSGVLGVDADLVHPSGFRKAFHEGESKPVGRIPIEPLLD